MRLKKLIILPVLLVFIAVSGFVQASVEPKAKKIYVVHSYSMDYEWTAGEDDGIVRAVNQFQDSLEQEINVERFFLEGKKNKESPELIDQKIKFVKKQIQESKPDGVILTDDLAVSLFYTYLLEREIPFTFCGVNGVLEKYGYKPGDQKVTGTLERYNLIPTLKIIAGLRPTVDTVTFIGDISLTTDVLFGDLKRQSIQSQLTGTNIQNVEYFAKEYFDELQEFLLSLDPQKNAIVYMAPYTYTDRKGNHVNYRQVDAWASEHTRIIDAGITNYQVKNGRLMSLASNQVESGYFAANGLLQGLSSSTDLSKQEIRQYLPLQLILNSDRAKNLDIEIPFHLLSYSYESKKLFNTFNIK